LWLILRKYLRIAPVFYTIFFLGWVAGAFLHSSQSSPQWYLYQSLYQDCDRYWWSQLLFLGNWFPFFEDGNRGCFFWGFGIYCDLQLFLLIPPIIYLYVRSPKMGMTFMYLMIGVNIAVNVLVAWKYDLKAGPLALENYYLFSYLMYKPYSKLAQLSIGMQFGILYTQIIKYRASESKGQEYPRIHYMHEKRWVGLAMTYGGIGLVITCLFCGYEALKDPYAWPLWKNLVYFAFVRPAYVLGSLLTITAIFLG
jgi:hypothetical protein